MDKEELVHHEGYGARPRSLRAHWVNCCQAPDEEVIDIDRMEDALSAEERARALPIRQLIARYEVCHWNAERWLERIVQGIAEERVPPTSGRPRTEHPLARMLACLRSALTHWVARSTAPLPQCTILDEPSAAVVARLGAWTPYKAWVVQRIVEGLDRHMCSAGLLDLPADVLTPFYPGGLTLEGPEADAHFAESRDLLTRARSQRLKVKPEAGGQVEMHSLALVVGHLNPCSERYLPFTFALFEVLDAPDEEQVLPAPFCGDVSRRRQRRTYRAINALRAYLGKPPEGDLPKDETVLARLGDPTAVKRWLVASLEKTLREQTPRPPAQAIA